MTVSPAIAADLREHIAATLEAHIFDNRAALIPTNLATIAGQLAAIAQGTQTASESLGGSLCEQGLAFTSLTAALDTALTHTAPEAARATTQRFSRLLQEYHAAELQRISREQQHIYDAVRDAALKRDHESELLHAVIQELSTPVVPVYDGVLIVPLIGAIDTARAGEITARLLDSITQHRASAVILDITGVPIVDTSIAQHLLQTTYAARLLGTEVVLVGINPVIAQTIVQLGIDMSGVITRPDLAAGVEYALRRRGLGIRTLQPLAA